MSKKIESIEGIGPKTGEALRAAGIKTVDQLLDVACDKRGRQQLADQIEITESRVLQYVNMADLFRVKGVASQYAELLVGAGVDTVKELKHRNVENLVTKMNEINADKKLVRSTPSVKVVASWIDQAKSLPAKITH